MKLTIEKAKEIVLEEDKIISWHGIKTPEYRASKNFIEGWNQAIETIEKNFLSSIKPFDLNHLEKLKVNGEK